MRKWCVVERYWTDGEMCLSCGVSGPFYSRETAEVYKEAFDKLDLFHDAEVVEMKEWGHEPV